MLQLQYLIKILLNYLKFCFAQIKSWLLTIFVKVIFILESDF